MKNLTLILCSLLLIIQSSHGEDNKLIKNVEKNFESFVQIKKYVYIKKKNINISIDIPKEVQKVISDFNSFLILNGNLKASAWLAYQTKTANIYLTSNHVCEDFYGKEDKKTKIFVNEKIARIISGTADFEKYYEADTNVVVITNNNKIYNIKEIVNADKENDLCLFSVKGLFNKPLKIAKDLPEIGDIVYNISSPEGIFSKGGIPVFLGIYSGKYNDENNSDIYTIYSKPGSSGSPVFNTKGELIGAIHSTIRNNYNISLATNITAIKDIIKKTNTSRH